jgi:hypothetical protein
MMDLPVSFYHGYTESGIDHGGIVDLMDLP